MSQWADAGYRDGGDAGYDAGFDDAYGPSYDETSTSSLEIRADGGAGGG
jgi:hypothetical protein